MDSKIIKKTFTDRFGSEPLLVNSPGRVNLIGEHTDYNEGYVLPAAIDKSIVIAIAANNLNCCRLYSTDYGEYAEFDLNELQPSQISWANYILGVASQFQQAGYAISGFDCVFGGDIPIGAGLSSSAALECGIALALNELYELMISRQQLIKYAQKAEHEFAGVQCGIMDQFASMMGKKEHAIQLDCRSLEYQYFPLSLGDYQILLLDTQVKHSLASSEYNTRRNECEQGVGMLQLGYPEITSLRDVSPPLLMAVQNIMDPVVYKRCMFILKENERLLEGCNLLKQGDIEGFGALMYASHAGLSSMYEVSCEELDFLVSFTMDKNFVAGARMMGGGFGGCTINLVKTDQAETFMENISQAYEGKFGVPLKSYKVTISEGTKVLKEERAAAE